MMELKEMLDMKEGADSADEVKKRKQAPDKPKSSGENNGAQLSNKKVKTEVVDLTS